MMYRYYVLKVIFKQIKSKSPLGLPGRMNCKSCMADTLLFKKETHFCMIFWSACAWLTTMSAQSIFPSHSDLQSQLPSHNTRYSDNILVYNRVTVTLSQKFLFI